MLNSCNGVAVLMKKKEQRFRISKSEHSTMPSRRDLSSGGVTYGKCQLMQPALLGGFSTLNLCLCVSFQ